MRLEIGAGEKPHPDYDLHVDMLPLPGIKVLCAVDRLPFATGSIDALRANHVLEHQSYELVADTLRERVLPWVGRPWLSPGPSRAHLLEVVAA